LKEIRFSHDYEKLPENWEGTQAVLLAVSYIPDLEQFFRRFPQMREIDSKLRGKDEYYLFGFKEAILLIFLHLNSSKLFSTIRRYTEWKYEYYKQSLNETFTLTKQSNEDVRKDK